MADSMKILTELVHDEQLMADFWSKVDVQSDPDVCWNWVGPATVQRYGHCLISLKGHRVYAHRVSYAAAGGTLEPDQVTMHRCHNGRCVNYRHLEAGTIQENNAARDAENRRTPFLPRGAQAASAKLTDRDVVAILAGREAGVPVKSMATMYGVSPATIYALLAGVTGYRLAVTSSTSDPKRESQDA